MTRKRPAAVFGFFVVVVFVVAGVYTAECPPDGPNEKCDSTTTSNEIEKPSALQTQEEVITDTPKPMDKPKSLNMLAEDSILSVFRPTSIPSSASSVTDNPMKISSLAEEPKGRALNFTLDEHSSHNVISNSSNHHNDFDLSDVTIDDDDDDFNIEMLNSKILAPKLQSHNSTLGMCEKGGLTYENGEKLENDCDSVCTCRNGKMDCTERCEGPFFRKGKRIEDPLCTAKDTEDPCCSVLVCAGDTETEPLEICSHGSKMYNRGDTFNKECSEVCICEAAGKISCKPRCPVTNKTSDRCVELPDPNDPCCKKILCDVTLDDNDPEREDDKPKYKVLSAKFINATTILLKFDSRYNASDDLPVVEVSDDKSHWKYYRMLPGGYVFVKESAKYLRLENSDDLIDVQNTELGPKQVGDSNGCEYKGKSFKLHEEYNDECSALCVCQDTGMKCLKIQCPTYFGVDVLDPHCVEWETVPVDFQPSAPNCCPETVHCKNNGSCNYKGETYKNWAELPANVTGCDKQCFCEMGKVECQNSCPPVTALPPPNLNCAPGVATLSHIPDDECCKYWVCSVPTDSTGVQSLQGELTIHTLEAVDPHTVRLEVVVPPEIVHLHGRVEVRYTHKDDDDVDNWMLQVFAPPSDIIPTPSLEFDLLDLKADTEYRIKVTVTLQELHNKLTSRIYSVRTPKEPPSATLPPTIPIQPDLAISDINSTWVTVVWRTFTQYELQFIDAVQLRYKEIEGKIYTATPFIHRAVTRYTLEHLKPNTKYEMGIYFIPFSGQMTELHAENLLHFTSANEVDTYGFNVSLEVSQVKSQSVEISWNGVPYPEDKYVNIYRAIYQSDSGKEDQSTFKIAKRDSPTKTVIMDLKPGTRYRIWLDVYLTNGKIKISNVQEFVTKPRLAPALGNSLHQDKLARAQHLETKGDYYGPLVIVAILAAVAILTTLILLLILVRRHNQNKAAITPPSTRISQSAYDNPTYKVEIQQETMGL